MESKDDIVQIVVDAYFRLDKSARATARELNIPRTTVRRKLKEAKSDIKYKGLFGIAESCDINNSKNIKILAVGDCHISDKDDLIRFKYLADFIIEKRPYHIVIMGDFLTFQCMSGWDRDKRMKMEGKRYKNEIEKGNEALNIIINPIIELQSLQKFNGEKVYSPEIVYMAGNHEDRVDRYLEYDPTFEGLIGVEKDLRLKERGIKFIPYREYHTINDIAFTHIPFNKAKEVSGVNITRKVSHLMFGSIVFAHVHSMEYEAYKRHGQKDLQQILTTGCFFEEHEDYVHGRITEYWKGLVLLNSWKPGRFDVEMYSLDRLKQMY